MKNKWNDHPFFQKEKSWNIIPQFNEVMKLTLKVYNILDISIFSIEKAMSIHINLMKIDSLFLFFFKWINICIALN